MLMSPWKLEELHAACCLCRRQALVTLQHAEAIQIRRDSDAFQVRMDAYRAFFQKAAPFMVPGGTLKLEQVYQ